MTQKKKPVLRFKGFTDDWEQRKLGEMLEFRNGFNGSSEIYGGDTPLISVMDILNNNFITHDKILAHVCVDNNIKERFKISYGDVLFQRSSENYEDAGTSNVYIDRQNNAIFGGFVIAGKKLKEYDPICFKYLLDSKYVRNQIIRKAQGAQHINVSQDTLQNVAIYIPNMEEQNKIGAYLHNIDHLITLHQRKYEKLRNLKKFFLEKIFPQNGKRVPEVRFAGFTGDWEQRKLGELAEFNPKASLPDSFEYVDLESVVGTRIINHRTEKKDSAPSRAQRLAQPGDVFYQTVRPYQRNNCLFTGAEKSYVFSTGYAQLRSHGDSYFLLTMLQKDDFVNSVMDRCTGTSYPAINSNELAEINVIFPTIIQEQKELGQFFKNIDNLITLHQRKLEKLQNLKKAALDKMFV